MTSHDGSTRCSEESIRSLPSIASEESSQGSLRKSSRDSLKKSSQNSLSRPSQNSLKSSPQVTIAEGIPQVKWDSKLQDRVSMTLLLLSVAGTLAFVMWICFLWFTASEHKLWRKIALKDWMAKSITLVSAILRIATTVQAGIASSMLAAITLEGPGILLPKLATLSMMRASAPLPHCLSWQLLSDAKATDHRPRSKWVILCLAICLSFTTLLLQFTSTIMLVDVGTGMLPSRTDPKSFSAAGSNEMGNKWNVGVRTYPVFAEYANDSTIDRTDGVSDTGVTMRAFLPLNEGDRAAVLHYQGPATVVDTRVTCVRPIIDNLHVLNGTGRRAIPVLNGTASIPPELIRSNSSRLYEFKGSNFSCEISQGFLESNKYHSSDWNFTLCQMQQAPGVLLPEFLENSRSGFSSLSSPPSYLAMNYSGVFPINETALENATYSDSDQAQNYDHALSNITSYLRNIFEDDTPGLTHENRSEWLDVYRNDGTYNAKSAMLSFSLCFSAFESEAYDITASAMGTYVQPSFIWNPETLRFEFAEVRNQLGASLPPITTQRDILSFEALNWEEARLDNVTYLSKTDTYDAIRLGGRESNQSRTIQFLRSADDTGYSIVADISIIGLGLEVLQSGGTISKAVQSMLMTAVASRYYRYIFVEGPNSYNQTLYVEALVPGGDDRLANKPAGATLPFVLVMTTLTIHCATVIFIIVWFYRATSATLLWNSWQAIAQVRSLTTDYFLTDANMAKDREVEKWMRDEGLHKTSVAITLDRSSGTGVLALMGDIPDRDQE